MRNKPGTPAETSLLNLARRVLHEDMLDELPEAARYRTHMIGNAMAIAARAMSDGGRTRAAELKALAALYGEAPEPVAGADAKHLNEEVTRLNWWLTAEIRAGRRDGDSHVYAMLRASALGKLRLVNPKALRARDL